MAVFLYIFIPSFSRFYDHIESARILSNESIKIYEYIQKGKEKKIFQLSL